MRCQLNLRLTVWAIFCVSFLLAGCDKLKLFGHPELLTWSSEVGVTPQEFSTENVDLVRVKMGNAVVTIDKSLSNSGGESLNIGSTTIVSNDMVDIAAIYPSISHPDFLIVTSASKGTCCPWTNLHVIRREDAFRAIEVPATKVLNLTVNKNADGYVFTAKHTDSIDAAGDEIVEELVLGPGDKFFMDKDLKDKYPMLAKYGYPAEIFQDKPLRAALFNVSDPELKQLRASSMVQIENQWIDGASFQMCFAVKGQWGDTQVILMDLKSGGFEVQKFKDQDLDSAKSWGAPVRESIRRAAEAKECFETRFVAEADETLKRKADMLSKAAAARERHKKELAERERREQARLAQERVEMARIAQEQLALEVAEQERAKKAQEDAKQTALPFTADEAIKQYAVWISKHIRKSYPRIAQMRGWSGTVDVELSFNLNGAPTVNLKSSSGYEVLDLDALKRLRDLEYPPVPEPLKGKPFKLDIPLVYSLS